MFNCLDLDHLINSDIQIHSIRRILTVVWQCTLYSWFSKESNSHQINYIILCFRMSPFIFQWLWCMIHDSKENRCNTYVKCMYESFLQVCDRKQKQISKQHGTQSNNALAPFIIIPIVFVSFILFGIIYWCCIYLWFMSQSKFYTSIIKIKLYWS